MDWASLAVALVGHLVWHIRLYNRVHATRIPHRRVKRLERFAAIEFLVVGSLMALTGGPLRALDTETFVPWRWVLDGYGVTCWAIIGYVAARWVLRRFSTPAAGRCPHETSDVIRRKDWFDEPPLAPGFARFAGNLPCNEILDLDCRERELIVDGLPANLEGLRIVHASDLHFTGRIGREYFERVVERIGRWEADLVCVTGDLVDRSACLDWIPATLGRLPASRPNLFILGNHDARAGAAADVRAAVRDAGFEDLGARAHSLDLRGCQVLAAGNELPWYSAADVAPDVVAQADLSLLLSHAPDQLPWARARGFRLMLAGHTHGGQIQLPVLGPVVCPSRYGARYACGVFYERPTVLHVTRGISGVHPFRWNCRPEIVRLTLTGNDDAIN